MTKLSSSGVIIINVPSCIYVRVTSSKIRTNLPSSAIALGAQALRVVATLPKFNPRGPFEQSAENRLHGPSPVTLRVPKLNFAGLSNLALLIFTTRQNPLGIIEVLSTTFASEGV